MDAFSHYEKIEIDEDTLPEVDEEEVAQHNTPEDLWVIIYGRVYDVTEWQHEHPGGDFILQEYGGKDASDMFRSVQHSPDANGIRPNFMVARLKKKAKPAAPVKKATGPSKKSKL
jgi:cytochrome b involved in lipid metabolism